MSTTLIGSVANERANGSLRSGVASILPRSVSRVATELDLVVKDGA